MSNYISNRNTLETGQSPKIKFIISNPNGLEGGVNDTSKFSFKNLPGTQYSLANTETHYKSRILAEGSFFRQAEQQNIKEISISKKGSIVEQMEGILPKNTSKTPEAIEKQQNQGLFLAQSHVLERHNVSQQTKLQRYTQLRDNKKLLQSHYIPTQTRNNIVFAQSPQNYFQSQSFPTKRTDQTQWVETTIERPKYVKKFENRSELYRTVAPDEDPKMAKTVCAPWCWILWGVLGLGAAVLGIIFGLRFLPIPGITQGSTIITPTQPETNIATPATEPLPITQPEIPYENWVDPVPIEKIPVYTTVQTLIGQNANPENIALAGSLVPETHVRRVREVQLPQKTPGARAHLTSPSPLR